MRAAVLFGDAGDSGRYAELIESQRDLSGLRDGLLLGEFPAGSAA